MNLISNSHINTFLRLRPIKIFYFIPFFAFSLVSVFLSLFTIYQSQTSTFAAPGAPGTPGNPASLSTSVSSPVVNFNFNGTEIQSSTFKSSTIALNVSTNNITGATTYISSVDEDTSLNPTDSSVAQKITSIASSISETSFAPKKWGYRASRTTPSGNFKPIAKLSSADILYTENNPATVNYNVEFGVKSGPDLLSGAYTKQILFSSITNHVPTSTTFISGPKFNKALIDLGAPGVVKSFKHSTSAPPAGANTTVVSTTDSDVPAYVWYDAASQSILWYSDADTTYANEDSSHMFNDIGNNYSNMSLIDTAGINTSRVKNMSYMFHGGKWIIKKINLAGFDTSNVEDMSYMFASYAGGITENIEPIDFSNFNTSKVTNMQGMFSGSFFRSINIRNFDTSNVTNMSDMFSGLHETTSLDLSNLNVKKVNVISRIFLDCRKLQDLNLSGWELDSVISMDGLFSNLPALTSLNLSNFKTKNVNSMRYMFAATKDLVNLNLSSFDTSKVTSMEGMFQNMNSLTNINLSSFDTRNVTNMSKMFSMTSTNPPITNLDLSSFNTSQVTTMERMFEGLAHLQNLNVSSFDTRNVTNMEHMFYYTFVSHPNGILDLSSFDTHSLQRADGMFNYMKVKTIYASPDFVTTNLTPNPSNIFMSTDNLVGGNGTAYTWPNYTSTFARIDTPGNPGYFTQKP